MAHSHDHAHNHHPHPHQTLIFAIALIFLFAIIEVIAGWISGSLTLLSDAGHMFSDGMALIIAAFASWLALQPPSSKHSYGLGRAEVVAAGLSSLVMLAISVTVIIEAIHRLHRVNTVQGGIVIAVGFAGLIINGAVAWLLARGQRTLNIRAALLHVMSDVLGSVAALIAGAVIYFTHWMLIDPILSILVGILILVSSLSLIRESLLVLMEGVPGHLDYKQISEAMHQVAGVKDIHDLHIWTLSSGKIALSAHVNIYDFSSWQMILPELKQLLTIQYAIEHITLQPEPEVVDCQPCQEP
ncbi:MAG: cation transporter [Proteobacteria bacterium]|nr:cation transporter [Pseudomonadota bacterium]